MGGTVGIEALAVRGGPSRSDTGTRDVTYESMVGALLYLSLLHRRPGRFDCAGDRRGDVRVPDRDTA